MLPTFKLFSIEFSVYGLLAATGLILMGLLAYWLGKDRIKLRDIIIGELTALLGAFIGAHLLFAFTNSAEISQSFSDFFSGKSDFGALINDLGIYAGGMVFYGGLIFGLIFGAIYCKIRRIELSAFSDCFAVGIPLFHFFGRMGCFFSGCCYGIESPIGFTFHDAIVHSANGVQRFPVQLLESFLNLIIFSVLILFFQKGIFKGKLILIYLILYSVVRFSDEFLRGDEYREIYFGLSLSQWISIVLLAVSLIIFLISNKKSAYDFKSKYNS